jgi:hypothetical protein
MTEIQGQRVPDLPELPPHPQLKVMLKSPGIPPGHSAIWNLMR